MTLFIQRANRRDNLALHAKLDELLRVDNDARSELTQLDEQEPEAIEQHRDEEVRKSGRLIKSDASRVRQRISQCPKLPHQISLLPGTNGARSGLFRHNSHLIIPRGETTCKSVPVTTSPFNASKIPR